MHSALVQEPLDLFGRDTEVSVPVFRRHRLRGTRAGVDAPVEGIGELGDIAVSWVDPGDIMAPATAASVTLREAIVRRNHLATKPKRESTPSGCVEIDWARSSDRRLSIKRVGRGVLRISGASSGRARISLGIDGLAFTVSLDPSVPAANAIRERLKSRYQSDIIEEAGGTTLLVLRSHT